MSDLLPVVTVLIVDDDDFVLRMLGSLLGLESFEVLAAQDGEAALELLRRQPGKVDLAVVDLVMPGISGDALIAALREIEAGLPILVMSGHTEIETYFTRGDDARLGILEKPFDPAKLGEYLRKFLSQATAG